MKKEILKIDMEGNKAVETMSYKIEIIDSVRSIATSLTKLADNLLDSEEIHENKCKDCSCSLECESVKNNLI